ELDRMAKPQMLKKEDIQKSLSIIVAVFIAASEVLPPLSGEDVTIEDTIVPLRPIVYAKLEKEIDLDGRNIRCLIMETMHDLINYILTTREEDTKSLTTICLLYCYLVYARTFTPATYNQTVNEFAEISAAFSDPVRGKQAMFHDQIQTAVTLIH
uniref:Uncharacterized protein n=1 Tax=Panagrolaimus sp. JU765 TaxID=591449 RepID=A0AC34Q7W2_9BILA